MEYTKKIVYQSNYWYNDGLRKAKIRDMSGAIMSLRKSLQFNRENIAARNLLGLVYYGIGEVPEALVEWIISKNLKSRDNIADYYIKNVQSSAKELEQIDLAIKKYNQCLTYCRQNGEDLAAIQLKQVIAAHPTFLKAYQLLTLIYLHTGQYSQARQTIKTARKLDTTNEITLLYMHELTKKGKKKTKEEKKKEEAVEYSLGNETIIQPKHSRFRQVTAQLAVANIFIGAAIGAAIIWFLVAPAVNQSRSERMNDQMREYADEIKSLEAQISAQTRTLDNYRASGEDAQANAELAQKTAEGYEKLLSVEGQFLSNDYDDAALADALLGISRDTLKQTGQVKYDEIAAAVYPGACEVKLAEGTQALNSGDYAGAIDPLSKVVLMNEGYNDGQALLNLAQAYKGSGDNENATVYFQKVIEKYAGSEYAAEAQSGLAEITNENN